MERRWIRLGTSLAVVVVLGWSAPAASAATATTVEVEATVVQLAAEDAGVDDAMSMVEVDGRLYDLPDSVEVTSPTGTDVVVTLTAPVGMSPSQAIEAASDQTSGVTVVDITPSDDAESQMAARSVVGSHPVTILPVRWSSSSSVPSVAELTTWGTSGATYWSTQSGGRIKQSVTVRSWVTIAAPSGCDLHGILNAALAANGMTTPTGNNHVVVYFPYTATCGWAGMGSVGGGLIWVNGYLLQDVIAHEFGHNLGVGHASTVVCSAGSVALSFPVSGCAANEYGDYADVMGGSTFQASGSLNGAFADYLGLANVRTVTAGESVTVQLAPLGNTAGLRAVRIEIPGTGWLYLDYRPAVAPDTRRPGWAGVQAHLMVTNSSGTPSTRLLDVGSRGTFTSPQVTVGPSWTVPGTNTAVLIHSTGATATVQVQPASAGAAAFVSRVYQDLFGRAPDSTGLAAWTSALLTGQARSAVANGITASDEYRAGLISRAYSDYLGRGPDSVGSSQWLSAMRAGLSINQLESGFLGSDESYAKAGATDTRWVQLLYRQVLGRGAAPSEVAAWTSALSQGVSRQAVANGFVISAEHLSTLLDAEYVRLLGRHLDSTGQAGWIAAVQGGVRWEAVIGNIVGSDEYYRKAVG